MSDKPIKTGAFWAIASALFLIAGAILKSPVPHYVAYGYSFLAVLKAGMEA